MNIGTNRLAEEFPHCSNGRRFAMKSKSLDGNSEWVKSPEMYEIALKGAIAWKRLCQFFRANSEGLSSDYEADRNGAGTSIVLPVASSFASLILNSSFVF